MTKLAHPLEPLTAPEITATVNILRSQKNLPDNIRFISVVLKEPAKDVVKSFAETGSYTANRESFTCLYNPAEREVYDAVVDITGQAVTSWDVINGVQPTLAVDEQIACEQAVLNSPLFREAVKEYWYNRYQPGDG